MLGPFFMGHAERFWGTIKIRPVSAFFWKKGMDCGGVEPRAANWSLAISWRGAGGGKGRGLRRLAGAAVGCRCHVTREAIVGSDVVYD